MNNNNNDNDNDNNSTVTGNKDEDMDETGQTFVVSFFHKLFTVLYCTAHCPYYFCLFPLCLSHSNPTPTQSPISLYTPSSSYL